MSPNIMSGMRKRETIKLFKCTGTLLAFIASYRNGEGHVLWAVPLRRMRLYIVVPL